MSAEPSAIRGDRRGVPVWVPIVTLLAVALLAGGTAWYLASRATDDDAVITVEPEAETPASGDAEAEAPAVPTGEPEPSYVRYAYVRAVTGSPGNWGLSLDFFDILTGDDAEKYALSRGMTPPANGILYVNESEAVEFVPLSDTVSITYNTGGVEGLTTHPATVEQLRDWAAGSTTALPDAFRDQWRVTVVEGVVTIVEMIAVAD